MLTSHLKFSSLRFNKNFITDFEYASSKFKMLYMVGYQKMGNKYFIEFVRTKILDSIVSWDQICEVSCQRIDRIQICTSRLLVQGALIFADLDSLVPYRNFQLAVPDYHSFLLTFILEYVFRVVINRFTDFLFVHKFLFDFVFFICVRYNT